MTPSYSGIKTAPSTSYGHSPAAGPRAHRGRGDAGNYPDNRGKSSNTRAKSHGGFWGARGRGGKK